MQELRITTLATLGLSLALGLCLARPAGADDGHAQGAAQHGGSIVNTKHYQFEVVLTKDGLKVYPYGEKNQPIDTSHLTATASFYHPNTPKPWFDRPLRAATVSPGQVPASLDLAMDLSKVLAKGTKVTFEISGLPDPTEPTATITVPFATSTVPVAPAPLTITRATQSDQGAINAQKVCKVSGGSLGSMGVPIKVSRGDRAVFLCCQSCVKTIAANPDRFLGTMAGSESTKK
jgi:hypothetical protein